MSKKKKVKLNYQRIIIAVVAILIIIGILVFGITRFFSHSSPSENPDSQQGTIQTPKETYSLRSNATDYQKEIYQELQDALEEGRQKPIAESLAKNFVADFFTLSNKTMKNDIGGTQFWSSDARLGLREKAIDTFYTNLELYIADYGSENLPTVKEVTIKGSSSMNDYDLYAVEVTWTYEPNSKFDTSDFQKTAMVEITFAETTPYIYNFY